MSNNSNFNNMMLDESYQKYIIPNDQLSTSFHRLFDNNCLNDRVVINGKIDKIVDLPKNLNMILNIDISYGNIVHIPMVSNIYIEYSSFEHLINIKDLNNKDNIDLNIYNQKLYSDTIKILSVKKNKNITYQDILIQTNKNLIIIQIYKFSKPIQNITHGAFIIYQNDIDHSNQNNTIYYTKNSKLNQLTKINDINIIKNLTYLESKSNISSD
jgi:hypothetical protein